MKRSKIRIGEKVRMKKNKTLNYGGSLPSWYSTSIFTIIKIHEETNSVVYLDRNLSPNHGNTINIIYIKSVTKERKKKLLRLNSI